jgi:hypothetical protein
MSCHPFQSTITPTRQMLYLPVEVISLTALCSMLAFPRLLSYMGWITFQHYVDPAGKQYND